MIDMTSPSISPSELTPVFRTSPVSLAGRIDTAPEDNAALEMMVKHFVEWMLYGEEEETGSPSLETMV